MKKFQKAQSQKSVLNLKDASRWSQIMPFANFEFPTFYTQD